MNIKNLLEANKRKKRKNKLNISYTTGDIGLNIDHFNKCMGTFCPEDSETKEEPSFSIEDIGSEFIGNSESSISDSSGGEGGLSEEILREAKRIIKRYYIRPQNIFCSNKTDILKTLAEIGNANCSVYSLKNLEDHDDVHKLTNSDIIYYYDNNVLYDKNHIQVLDYDLSVKNEEERKNFGTNTDSIADSTFRKEYDDRLTDRTLDLAESYLNSPNFNSSWYLLAMPEERISYYKTEQTASSVFDKIIELIKQDPLKYNPNYVLYLQEFDSNKDTYKVVKTFKLQDLLKTLLNSTVSTESTETEISNNSANEAIPNINNTEEIYKENNSMMWDSFSDSMMLDYDNNLTEAILTPFKANAEAKVNSEAEREFNNQTLPMLKKLKGITLRSTNIYWDYYNNRAERNSSFRIDAIFVGKDTGKIRLASIRRDGTKEYLYLEDVIKHNNSHNKLKSEKRTIYNGHFWKEDQNKDFYNIIYPWLELRKKAIKDLNDDTIQQRSTERTIKRREDKLNISYKAIEGLSPKEFTEIAVWLVEHTTNITFKIPKIDDDLSKLDTSNMSLEKADRARDKIEKKFSMLDQEFKRQMPHARLDKDYSYRYTSEESDNTYDLWNISGKISFNTKIENAPIEVITLMEKARDIALRKGFKIKDIEKVKQDNYLTNYYFCLMVLKMFDYDFEFYNNYNNLVINRSPENGSQEENPFNQEFEPVDVFGDPIKETLTESEHAVCCICGESIEGYGNNPQPIKDSGKCCDACNLKFVIPARLEQNSMSEE